jgi:hypothetical protein
MPLRYTFREPTIFHKSKDADPNVIGQELTRIKDANNGRLMPQTVVEEARKRSNPLHRHFEWNDKIAAEAYRLDQARELIRIIQIEDTDGDKPARRAFVSVTDDGKAYRGLNEVLNSQSLQLAVLVTAERELRAFEVRYNELLDICELVRDARSRLRQRIQETQGENRAAQ